MNIKKCKVGTRVQLKGTIIEGANDVVSVHVRGDDGRMGYVTPNILKPAAPDYDPKRKFRKGDIARIDYKGRERGAVIPEGTHVEVLKDEYDSCIIKVKVGRHINSDGWMYADVDHLVLIRPIEEIEEELPYFVEDGAVNKRDGDIVVVFSYSKFGAVGANSLAQEICDELNSEYKKLQNH